MTAIETIGVIGAGQMGGGIAHVFALSSYRVMLHDVDPDRIKAAAAIIEKNIARQVAKGVVSEADLTKAMAAISPAPRLEDLRDCDLVIEAATENLAIKKKIF
ncbi:MAG: 3-hydroxyacyl-CoA dehydrogenase NAD-binding domain-containing protein, partial [Amphiplicatus sp.]